MNPIAWAIPLFLAFILLEYITAKKKNLPYFHLQEGAYPFFIHTGTIGKLGWLEYILVTPSHHRVHHARNEQYLDCNYGDVLIIWDKLFGTFVPETEAPEYGLTKPLNSHSFLWQHFHYFIELFYAMRGQRGWRNKLILLWARPASISPEFRELAERKFLVRSRDRSDKTARPFNRYVIGQLTGVLILLFVFLLWERHFNPVQQGLVTLTILLTLVNCGALMEQRRWIFYLEYVRLGLAVLLLYVSYPDDILLTWGTAIIMVLAICEPVLKKNYFRWVGIPAQQ